MEALAISHRTYFNFSVDKHIYPTHLVLNFYFLVQILMQDCLDTIAQQLTLNYKDNFNDEKISGFSTVKMTVGGNLR